MSTYGAPPRRVNVSQYLRNLNVQGPSVEENFTDEDLEKDLALFTNTQFFDFETGQHTDYQAPPVKPEASQSPEDATPADSLMGDFASGYEFPIAGSLPFSLIFGFLASAGSMFLHVSAFASCFFFFARGLLPPFPPGSTLDTSGPFPIATQTQPASASWRRHGKAHEINTRAAHLCKDAAEEEEGGQ